jgi:hypothetical protein
MLALPWALNRLGSQGSLAMLLMLIPVLLFWLWLAACSLIAAKAFSRAASGAVARWRRENTSERQ